MLTKDDLNKLAYGGLALWMLPLETVEENAQQVLGPTGILLENAKLLAQKSFLELHTQVSERLSREAEAFMSGAKTADQFKRSMEDILERAYKEAAYQGKFAAGKYRQLSEADRIEVNAQWQNEKGWVERLAKAGVADARFPRRVQMYADALRSVFHASWANHMPKGTVFIWHMHPGAVHCSACLAAANKNGDNLPKAQYRVNELPFYPGRSPVCLTNCMCWLTTTSGAEGAPQVREPASSGETNPE